MPVEEDNNCPAKDGKDASLANPHSMQAEMLASKTANIKGCFWQSYFSSVIFANSEIDKVIMEWLSRQ